MRGRVDETQASAYLPIVQYLPSLQLYVTSYADTSFNSALIKPPTLSKNPKSMAMNSTTTAMSSTTGAMSSTAGAMSSTTGAMNSTTRAMN